MREPLLDPTIEQRLRHELAVPYVAVVDCHPESGDWIRRAAYPDLLEQLRIELIVDAVLEGRELPTSRRPLRGGTSGLCEATLRTIIRDAITRRVAQ